MLKILSLIPKPIWFALGGALLMSTVIFTSYREGVRDERTRQELAQEKIVKEQVTKGLKEAQEELEEALSLQKKKDQILTDQSSKLKASEKRSDELQELLDEVLSNPPTECDRLPEPTYRLYKDMYNKRPSDRTN